MCRWRHSIRRGKGQMAERIVGPPGSKRRRRFLWIPMLTICAFALLFIGNASGVSITSGFELDASLDLSNGSAPKAAITDNTANAVPDDWDRICHTFTITNDTGSLYPDQCASASDDHAVAR